MNTSLPTDIHSIARALGGKAVGRNRVRCPGPGHSRKDRSLSVTLSGDSFFVHSFAEDDWRTCREHVCNLLGISDDAPRAHNDNLHIINTADLADEQRRIDDAARLWASSVPLTGTLAERYLTSRGLEYGGEEIRFRPGDRSMVAMMTDAVTGEPCGVHRTFLDADGKKINKKMRGRAKGAVVRLSSDEDVTTGLAIAEGIETALAAPFRPIWACLSAGGIAAFPVLSGIEALTIFADNDASGTGMKAARACAGRWHEAGREAVIHVPTETGADFATFAEAA